MLMGEMTTDYPKRLTIVGSVGLLGASAGIVVGLLEAGFMRLSDWPLALMLPHVPRSFWAFAPLLAAVTFGLLGLLAGLLAALPRSRFLGMVIIAALAGLAGAYLALVVQYTQSASLWYPALGQFVTPAIFFAVVFTWTLLALWATRKPGSPSGFLSNVPLRLWSGVVFGIIALSWGFLVYPLLTDHLTGHTNHATGKTRSPNIVLIVWDTTRADHFSSYGYFRNTTPNVDQFAKRGVLFENAISSSSWTLPAMASIFTSLLPHQHGGGKETVLGNGPRTLAEILRMGGYETAGFNANPYYGNIPWGLARGFETYLDSTRTLGYSFDATRIGREFIEPYSEEWFHRSRFNQPDAHQLNQQVYRWFDHRSDRPFFLFLNYNDAHEPYEVPSPYNRLYVPKEAKHLLHTRTPARFYLPPAEREGTIAAYDQCLNYIDSQVGELLRFLEQSPEWSNTYIIITSDHGEGFGEHDTYSHGWNLYREVLRVPLIIAGPGIPVGVRVTGIARTWDIFATALEWAGLKQAVLRRTSLARLWAPGYAPNIADEPSLSELLDNTPPPYPQGLISVTTREWHFICRPGYRRNRLYHWPTDPSEQHNVADLPENQAVVEHLKASLLSIIERSYRPWRDTGYLAALAGPDFSPDAESLKSIPSLPGEPLLPPGAGAAQSLFRPNPESPQPNSKNPDKELLESLPYDAR
jgi:arylsulfatase A-like enzyme